MRSRQILLIVLLGLLSVSQAFSGSSSITITLPPQSSFNWGTITSGDQTTIYNDLVAQTSTFQNQLNSQYFSHLHDLNDLSRGFANSNTLTSNNLSNLGFENYDLFTLFVGTNAGFALPGFTAQDLNSIGNSIASQGDVYSGFATGGVAVQLGINAGFLVKNLYLSLKYGRSSLHYSEGGSGAGSYAATFQQTLVGLGVDYKLIAPADFGFGFVKWRGISVGSGLNYNGQTINLEIGLQDQTKEFTNVGSGYTVDYNMTNIVAKLAISSSSLVVPVDVGTSIQLFWFLNLAFGVGADIALPSSQISIQGSSNSTVSIPGASGFSSPSIPMSVTATDSKANPGFWDYVSPRLSWDVGLDVAIFKVDIPVEYYPLSKALSLGINGGIAW